MGSTSDPYGGRRRRYGNGSNSDGGECAASLAMITFGLIGGMFVTRRARQKRP